MLDDMMTLSGTLKDKLNEVELKISLVKKIVAGSPHCPNISHSQNPWTKILWWCTKRQRVGEFSMGYGAVFKVARILDDEKVLITSMYLSEDAKL